MRKARLRAITEARRRLLLGLVVFTYGLLMLAMAFVLYGGIRTMGSEFGFTWRAASLSAAFTAMFLLLPQLAATMLMQVTRRVVGSGMKWLWVASTAAWVVGCGVSETLILADERRFEVEVQERGNVSFSRPRSWPNGDAGLVYNAGKFHATD